MFYDNFSPDYDRFVSWSGRLAIEMPFLEQKLRETGARRVLDAACGTGMHAIALAQVGFETAGADLSAGMISVPGKTQNRRGWIFPSKPLALAI